MILANGRRHAFALFVVLACGSTAAAQRLPIRHYSAVDGLPHNQVNAILQDRAGYLWVGTSEGLSRFDGVRFTTYTTADGLGHPFINDIVEDRSGHLWIATNGGGIARLADAWGPNVWTSAARRQQAAQTPQKRFISYRVSATPESNAVNALVFDADGNLWCATDDGVYRAALSDRELKVQRIDAFAGRTVLDAFADAHNRLWFWVLDAGVMHVRPDGSVSPATRISTGRRGSIAQDRQGRLVLAVEEGLFELVESTGQQTWKQRLPRLDVKHMPRAMLEDRTGTQWVATARGVVSYNSGRQRLFSGAHGPGRDPQVLYEDRDGRIWVGSEASGLYRIAADAAVSYGVDDGLPAPDVASVAEGTDGTIFARLNNGEIVEILEDRVVRLPATHPLRSVWTGRRILTTRGGDWWALRPGELCRTRAVTDATPKPPHCFAVGDSVQSWQSMDVPDIHEDRSGRIRFATTTGLYRLTPAGRDQGRIEQVVALSNTTAGVMPVLEDKSGATWLLSAIYLGRVKGGTVSAFQPTAGLPQIYPRSVLLDSRGRLWIGMRYGGVSMTAAPEAEHPVFVNYSTRNGLSSDTVWSIAEDDLGHIYFGTGRGLDRLDASTGSIRRFTSHDGLAGDLVTKCFRDSRGFMWIATWTGLSRLDPRAVARQSRPVPTFLTRVRVAGEDLPLPEGGIVHAPPLKLPFAHNNILIEYVGPAIEGQHGIRYQYKLDGIDNDWTQPADERSVNYARLAPGTYKFAVRSISRDGVPSAEPATMAFEVLPAFWQRGWFTALVMGLAIAGAVGLHGLRVRRILAMERIRRQIATDLHDDVGAGLSQVALLTEVIKRDAPPSNVERLTEIGGLARSMRDSMSDIVWAVDPRKDHLSDLVGRMRQAALNSFSGEATHVEFHAPDEAALQAVALAPDRRRHLLLILKEAVTNIARHADASRVDITLTASRRELTLVVRDNGRGFDAGRQSQGHGLESLRRRTRELGGELRVESAPGTGTRLEVRVKTA